MESRRRLTAIRDLLIVQASLFCGEINCIFRVKDSVAEEAPPGRHVGNNGIANRVGVFAPAHDTKTEGGGSTTTGGGHSRSDQVHAAGMARSSSIANAIAAAGAKTAFG
ncbi:hypothetical protein TraAM80_02257 [Trypanosoma rangeli]|uniref:Uncharacterized protein n=1 Tax=Trypanosoma rangeli TaxID=5698 RepID=A0A422NV34_TRYRA|nr:uncharacterized protein TraAM80_02257 [Trypanosoma rangeli]RNF09310.1 hypothetical protein TraAM80_02257 [Trypanosoma rangeli]|eukprot:RNF09310.1 hypothetical protein TraAM80_02257 [Trypanosoma rangeli]